MSDPWFARKWAALRLLGRQHNGTDANNPAEWLGAALNATSRSLHSLLRGNDGTNETTIRTLSTGVARIAIEGSAATRLLQDANNTLVVSKPGAIGVPSTLAMVHVSTGANTLIFSAPGTQEFCVERILLANANGASNIVTLARSTVGNASRLYVGTTTTNNTTSLEGPIYIVPGKPLMGFASVGPGLTVNVEGYRVQ